MLAPSARGSYPGRRAPSALLFFVLARFVVGFVLIAVKPKLLGLEHRHQEVFALRVVRLNELLVNLIDDLLELVVREVDLQQQGAVHLEAPVMKVDATHPARAAIDREDLARLGADSALEARGFHRPREGNATCSAGSSDACDRCLA